VVWGRVQVIRAEGERGTCKSENGISLEGGGARRTPRLGGGRGSSRTFPRLRHGGSLLLAAMILGLRVRAPLEMR